MVGYTLSVKGLICYGSIITSIGHSLIMAFDAIINQYDHYYQDQTQIMTSISNEILMTIRESIHCNNNIKN